MRRIITSTFTLTLTLMSGCTASLGSDGSSDGETTTTTSDSGSEGGEFVPCSANNPCPDGQFCFNGLCALGCLSDGDCGEDQYCATDGDMLCHNNSVPTCGSDSECASSQVCINGYCSAAPEPEDAGCDLEDYLEDGCPSNAVCLEDPNNEDVGVCYEMPACDAEGNCPTGLEGAVCNDDYLPNKDDICLIGLCDTPANCPSEWACVRFNQSVVGVCSSGSFGSPCETEADCISGVCTQLPGLGGGLCN